jgi:hypothetical protein
MTVADDLREVMEFIEKGDWMHCGNYIIFGWDEYIDETGGRESMEADGLGRISDPLRANVARIGKAIYLFKQTCLPEHLVDSQWLLNIANAFRDRPEGEEFFEMAVFSDLIEKMPRIVQRLQMLDFVGVKEPIKGELEKYFISATQCYLFGLTVPCVMICRTSFEAALEHQLPHFVPFFDPQKGPDKKGKLEWYVDLGGRFGLFRDRGDDLTHQAHDFRKFSNDVIHEGKIPSEEETRQHLELLRKFAEMIMRKPKAR